MTASSSRYRDAGVDIDAGNALVERIKPLAKATTRVGVLGGIGGFGALFDVKAAGFRDPVLVATTDGVGTKLKIAIETGKHGTIGIDLVAMCVNDLIVQGAEPLFFLDYFATGTLEVEAASTIVAGIAEGCRQAGCALVGGETAEMPGMYAAKDYDLAGFAVGAAERDGLLPAPGMQPGCVVLGLASSGLHSNGFSLVRKIAAEAGLSWTSPAPFSTNQTLGDALLTPTRIYVKPVLKALKDHPGAVLGLAHITGGGLLENIPRVLPEALAVRLKRGNWPKLHVFDWLQTAGKIGAEEMARTFNDGIGMVLIVQAGQADAVRKTLENAGEQVFAIGEVTAREGGPAVLLEA